MMALPSHDEVRKAGGETAAKLIAELREKHPKTSVIGVVVRISFGTLDNYETVEVASADDGSCAKGNQDVQD